MSITRKPKVVSLFSGAGCFDLGFEAAGYATALTTDFDFDACQTITSNRRWTNIHAPIEDISDTDFLSTANLRVGELDLLIGGPPCQPYSKSANGAVGMSPMGFDDERAGTIKEYLRVVNAFRPKAFVIENVPQFITGSNERIKGYLERSISKINSKSRTNYKLSYCKINCAWYGVPQLRERLFIIGSRDGCTFEMPEIRFLEKGDEELGLLPYRNAWDSIGHINRSDSQYDLTIGGRWGNLINTIPPGQNYLWHTKRGGGQNIFEWRSRYWNFLLKLHPQLPSWTIAATPGQHTGPFHWENRRLDIKELQALQTVPAQYTFSGGITSIKRQIGNGVPSAIGELIGKEIRRQFFGERVTSSKLKLIPDLKDVPLKIRRLDQSIQRSSGISSRRTREAY